MASHKEILSKIAGVRKIQKITRAMQNVAASRMRSAKDRMLVSMPYANKIREVVSHIAACEVECDHPYLKKKEHKVGRVGYIVVSSDRGLCGGLNLNLFKLVMEEANKLRSSGIEIDWCLLGKKSELFFQHIQANIVAHVDGLGALPKVEDILGAIKVVLDGYREGNFDALFIAHNEFVNTINQCPVVTRLLPLEGEQSVGALSSARGYIYEPAGEYLTLIDTVVTRYIEAQVYQALVDNFACEQVARMMAMKSATDNSENLIDELQGLYNKARQSSITTEIAEVIGGAMLV